MRTVIAVILYTKTKLAMFLVLRPIKPTGFLMRDGRCKYDRGWGEDREHFLAKFSLVVDVCILVVSIALS